MANLTESPIYEPGIFQLEKTTPPLGGAPAFNGSNPSAGHANVQGLQLANRTAWLKENLAVIVNSYADIRAYTGTQKTIQVVGGGIAGTFRSRGVVSGFSDNNGTYIISSNGTVWERVYSGPVNVLWFECPTDGVTNCDSAFSQWASQLKTGWGVIPPISYNVTTIDFLTVGQSPTVGGLKVDATGASITGECVVKLDSCKRVTIEGLEGFQTDLHLNGVWFSQFKDCKMRSVVIGSSAGAVFSANYWNTFIGGQFQVIKTHPNSQGPSNKFSFYNTALRGNASQGYTSTQDYALRFEANQNAQSWSFYGGDISYHNLDIIYVSVSNTADIEIEFNGIYWDSKYPKLASRPKTRITSSNGHSANDMPNVGRISEVARGEQDAWRSDRAAGWKSFTGHNLIPNGDFADILPSYEGSGLPIGSLNGAVLTQGTGDGISGNYLNINQAKTTSNGVRFRPKAAPFTGRYTYGMVARNADAGIKTVRVVMGGLYFNGELSSTEWTYLNMTTGQDVAKGTTNDIQVYTEDGTAFNIDICYVSCFLGESGPVFLPSPKRPTLDAAVSWNPPSVASGAQVTQDVTVPGAAFGDFARASFSASTQGLALSASVTAPNTVQVVLRNNTAGAVDLGAATLRVRIDKVGY